MRISKFRRGETTYKCRSCTRLTRNTGEQANTELCPQCYEIAGIENAVNDGFETADEARERVERLAAEVRAKGGTPDVAFLEPRCSNCDRNYATSPGCCDYPAR